MRAYVNHTDLHVHLFRRLTMPWARLASPEAIQRALRGAHQLGIVCWIETEARGAEASLDEAELAQSQLLLNGAQA